MSNCGVLAVLSGDWLTALMYPTDTEGTAKESFYLYMYIIYIYVIYFEIISNLEKICKIHPDLHSPMINVLPRLPHHLCGWGWCVKTCACHVSLISFSSQARPSICFLILAVSKRNL